MRRHRLRSALTKRSEYKHNNSCTTSKSGHRHWLVIPRYSTRHSSGDSRWRKHHLGKHSSICRPPAHHYFPPTLHKTNSEPAKSSRRCRRQGLLKQATPTSRFPHTKELAAGRRPEAVDRTVGPAGVRPPVPRYRQARSWKGQRGGTVGKRVCRYAGCPR